MARYQQATAPQQSTPLLSVTGRYLALLYHVVSTLIAAPHRYAVLVVDPEARFDVTRLLSSAAVDGDRQTSSYPATPADLRHVHVVRPPLPAPPTSSSSGGVGDNPNPQRQRHLRDAVAAAREWILYAPGHGSRDRELWGVVVVGSSLGTTTSTTAAVDDNEGGGDVVVTAGWRGWTRVEREEVPGFGGGGGMSVEEALQRRKSRQRALEMKRWVAGSRWGVYAWDA